MIISKSEVNRLKAILYDIRRGIVPGNIAPAVLSAFFVENPHLLMTEQFDEHMRQTKVDLPSASILYQGILRTMPGDSLRFKIPLLEFRNPTGTWSGLIGLLPDQDTDPPFDIIDHSCVFLPDIRSVFRRVKAKRTALKQRVDAQWSQQDFNSWVRSFGEGLAESRFERGLNDTISRLESALSRPREDPLVLWTPKLWTPAEQNRQRSILRSTISPHLETWKKSGIHFDDLNPSEFEDLVGEVLFKAGLKVYKVRKTPQGGRDLLARGVLIPNEEPLEMAVEVKHRSIVDRPEVQTALYQNRGYPALLFVTSGRFTAGVLKEKARDENRLRLFLKDGAALGDLVQGYFALDKGVRDSLLGAATIG